MAKKINIDKIIESLDDIHAEYDDSDDLGYLIGVFDNIALSYPDDKIETIGNNINNSIVAINKRTKEYNRLIKRLNTAKSKLEKLSEKVNGNIRS